MSIFNKKKIKRNESSDSDSKEIENYFLNMFRLMYERNDYKIGVTGATQTLKVFEEIKQKTALHKVEVRAIYQNAYDKVSGESNDMLFSKKSFVAYLGFLANNEIMVEEYLSKDVSVDENSEAMEETSSSLLGEIFPENEIDDAKTSFINYQSELVKVTAASFEKCNQEDESQKIDPTLYRAERANKKNEQLLSKLKWIIVVLAISLFVAIVVLFFFR